uniref:Glutathione S-transferase class-mu 26 kDa isozyme 1 n=1 Tax=Fasciola hepatica TaxID=6192 RepID=GST29_FASHE|nr:RecName: Full=Glutathione S-transferase class-mu 26 kDa isozyme 1; Short=GST1; AltName: Full=Fh1 [Fasciola hepatica]prf//1905266D glutathione S transferase:ISOTYPE=GST1 [Fasciola hepatica]
MPAKLGYWKIRGLQQPVRLLLEYGEKYEEQIYERDDGEKWFSKKFELGLDLPNLPYYIDDKCKLTQSLAILRYIADKHGMIGSTPEERARVSMIEGAAVDLRQGLSRISYDPKFEQLKEGYLKDLPTTMKMWSDFLGKNPYLRGTSVSHVDFMVYEALDAIRYLEPHCLDHFPNLQQFMSRIEALPSIKAYMESNRFIKWPLNGWHAQFGGGDAPPSHEKK